MRLLPALLVAAAGGNRHTSGDAGFSSIEIEPANASLTVPLGGSAMQDYQVFGVDGGSRTEITGSCTLSIDPDFGTFAVAALTVGAHGGKTTVNASCGAQTGSTGLIISLTGTVVLGTAPPNSGGLFGGATSGSDASRTPALQYPLDQAVSPRNIPPTEIQRTGGARHDLLPTP